MSKLSEAKDNLEALLVKVTAAAAKQANTKTVQMQLKTAMMVAGVLDTVKGLMKRPKSRSRHGL